MSFFTSNKCVFYRTVCSTFNPFLDQDPSGCLSQPGCAFDFELSAYRTFLNQAILPGVPVCHLAIRNEAFHRQANLYIQEVNLFYMQL